MLIIVPIFGLFAVGVSLMMLFSGASFNDWGPTMLIGVGFIGVFVAYISGVGRYRGYEGSTAITGEITETLFDNAIDSGSDTSNASQKKFSPMYYQMQALADSHKKIANSYPNSKAARAAKEAATAQAKAFQDAANFYKDYRNDS